MTKKNKWFVFTLLMMMMSSIGSLNYFIPISELIPATSSKHIVTQPLNIDLLTIKTIVKAVDHQNIKEVDLLSLVNALSDSDFKKPVRNPFQSQSSPKTKSIKPQKRSKPITPPAPPKFSRPKIKLEGIVWDEQSPRVILNNEIHQMGDQIENYTIYAITDSTITLINDKDIFNVKLFKGSKNEHP